MNATDYSVRPTDQVQGLPAVTRQQGDHKKRRQSTRATPVRKGASQEKASPGDLADPSRESGKTDEEGNFVDVLA